MKRRLLTAAAALAACVPAAPAQAASPTHVAIVVTFEGTTVARCAPVESSGLADLESRYTVVVGQPPSPYAGFVFTINGHGTVHPDDTHYWAYYHRINGAWVYSSVGAASYRPAAGAVDGWAYDNGSQTPPKPPARTYSAVCGSSAPAPAPATTSAAAPPPASPRTTASRAVRSVRTSTARHLQPARVPTTASRRPAVAPATPSSSARTASPARQRASAAPSRKAATAATTTPLRPSTAAHPHSTAAASTMPVAAGRHDATPWAPVAALAAAAALGGGAWWRLRSGGRS